MSESLTDQFLRSMPFAAALGITAVDGDRSEITARLEWAPERCTSNGILHGGVLMAFADSTGAFCASLNLPSDAAGTTTIESKTNFMRAVRSGFVKGVSRPLHAGRTVIVVDTEVWDEAGRLVARTTQTQAVLRQPGGTATG